MRSKRAGFDIGYESGIPVSLAYTTHGSKFNGKNNRVQIDLGVDNHDNFIDPEERLRIALARQETKLASDLEGLWKVSHDDQSITVMER